MLNFFGQWFFGYQDLFLKFFKDEQRPEIMLGKIIGAGEGN